MAVKGELITEGPGEEQRELSIESGSCFREEGSMAAREEQEWRRDRGVLRAQVRGWRVEKGDLGPVRKYIWGRSREADGREQDCRKRAAGVGEGRQWERNPSLSGAASAWENAQRSRLAFPFLQIRDPFLSFLLRGLLLACLLFSSWNLLILLPSTRHRPLDQPPVPAVHHHPGGHT